MITGGAAVALSAALLCVSIAQTWLWPLGWLGLWPIFWLLDSKPSWRQRAGWGALWLLLISQFGFPYAVATAYHHLGNQNPLGAWLMGTTLGVITSLRYWVFLLLAAQRPARLWGWAAIWCAGELLIWQMMPVYAAVHVLGDSPFLQWAEVVGAPGLSWLWFVLSLGLYQEARARKPGWASVLFVALHLLGGVRLLQWRAHTAPLHVIGVVQGNQAASLKTTPEVGAQTRAAMLAQTLELQGKAEVVVWPEASLPLIEYTRLGGLAVGSQLVFVDFEPGTQAGYVVARLLDPQGRSLASYRKRKLIMMGEWTPGDPAHSLQVGERDQLLPTAAGPALPMVCFEGLWPGFVAGFHRRTGGEASWLVHLGSESSFASPLACRQSLHLCMIRAVELRRPLVRADNSGISGWVDPAGQLHQATPTFRRVSALFSVPIDPQAGLTLYARCGDWPLAFLIVGGLLLYLKRP